MTIFGVESTDQLLSHGDNVVADKIDNASFGGHAICESLLDPQLIHFPDGGYGSFFQMHAPYEKEGGWDRQGKNLEKAIVAKWEKAVPNFKRDKVIATTLG